MARVRQVATRNKRKILVVDDDVSVLALLLKWLEDAGHEAVTCQSVQAGTACLQSWHPDVLVTDVRVNGTNGLYLTVLANQLEPPVVSIVMSGFADPAIDQEARGQNARFMLKPLSREEFLSAILAPVERSRH